jgi:hypothetical protein
MVSLILIMHENYKGINTSEIKWQQVLIRMCLYFVTNLHKMQSLCGLRLCTQ